ncbi:MAG: allantoate amidohydrolase [Sphingomonas sp.]
MVSGGARAVARCDELGVAPYSDAPDMLFRAYLTPAHAAALGKLAEWMHEAGMTVRTDAAANLVGRYEGWRALPPLIVGSHIDSVRDAGRYDGPLGVMLGIETVAALHAAGKRPPFPIEIYAFGDEEGSRFPASMLTSRAVAGTLDAAELEVADRDGVTLAEALTASGLAADRYLAAAHGPALAYFEAHIEQGPVLEAAGLAVGVVTGIASQLRYQISVAGSAGHAGTTTMPLRRDALTAAAQMVLTAERVAQDATSDVVATVGRLTVAPGAPNVIPGRVDFTLDVRSLDPARRNAAAQAILGECERIAVRRGAALTVEQVNDFAASPCDPKLMDLLSASLAAAGQSEFRLPSGAGHDAMTMAALCPTAMLFLRCRGGVSHNPAEHVDPADAEIALQVMLGFIERLGENVG